MTKTAALILAAGRGTRARDADKTPKQWRHVAGKPLIAHSLTCFAGLVDQIYLAVDPAEVTLAETLPLDIGGVSIVEGGEDRVASVRAGLAAMAGDGIKHVLIHDAARAFTPRAVIADVLAALDHHEGAAPALPVTDALWRVAGDRVQDTQSREGLYRAQTPQGFHFQKITAAHDAYDGVAADDVQVARAFGIDVTVTAGHEDNFKVTYPQDFARAEGLCRLRGTQEE